MSHVLEFISSISSLTQPVKIRNTVSNIFFKFHPLLHASPPPIYDAPPPLNIHHLALKLVRLGIIQKRESEC